MNSLERCRALPGPMTVREVYAIASEEVKACAREGDDPGDVRSNLMPVNHRERGAASDRDEALTLLRTAMGPNKDRDEWFSRRARLLRRHHSEATQHARPHADAESTE